MKEKCTSRRRISSSAFQSGQIRGKDRLSWCKITYNINHASGMASTKVKNISTDKLHYYFRLSNYVRITEH
jgi:hypothetical protein